MVYICAFSSINNAIFILSVNNAFFYMISLLLICSFLLIHKMHTIATVSIINYTIY